MLKRLIRMAVVTLCAMCFLPVAAFADTLSSNVPTSGTEVEGAEVDYSTNAAIEISEDCDAALLNDSSFGISDYSRANKGTAKLYSQLSYGYRYPMANDNAFIAVVTDDIVIVYMPEDVLDTLGLDMTDVAFERTFLATLAALDDAAANGGPQFTDEDVEFCFTGETAVEHGGYVYGFHVEVEEGYYYATVVDGNGEASSDGASYAMTGDITSAAETTIVGTPTGFAALWRFLINLDWRPLWVSLKTAGVGLIVVFILGLLAAWGTVKVSDRWKGVFDTIFTIPMVLPPTVCGFLLLLFFGNSTAVGNWLISIGIDIVFTWPAAVIACIVVSFPLMYRSSRGAFEQLEPNMLDAARTLGWTEGRIFTRLMLPLGWPSIASGTVLAFARAIGEFGATLFFAGNYAGITQTIPIAIYFDWMAGQTDVAIFWVIVVILISFAVILFINIYSSHTQRYRRYSGTLEEDDAQ